MEYVDAAGTFVARVKAPGNTWFGESGEKGTPFIRVPLIVEEGPQAGREIVWQGWLTEAAFDRTVETLAEAFDWDGDLEEMSQGYVPFVDLLCRIVVESEEWEGKTRYRVKWLNPISGGGGKALEEAKLNTLLRSMGRKSKALAKAVRDSGGRKRETAPQRRERPADPNLDGGEEEDNIPF